MPKFKTGESRNQMVLFPETINEYIPEGHQPFQGSTSISPSKCVIRYKIIIFFGGIIC